MSFWPSDTAGQIADGISVAAFAGSILVGIYAKLRGNATDRSVRELRKDVDRRTLLPVAYGKLTGLCQELTVLQDPNEKDRQARLIKFVGEIEGTLRQIGSYSLEQDRPSVLRVVECFAAYQSDRSDATLQTLHEQMWKLAAELEFTIQEIRLGG